MTHENDHTIIPALVFQLTIWAQFPRFKVLAFYNNRVESAHALFTNDAIKFFREQTVGNGLVFGTISKMNEQGMV